MTIFYSPSRRGFFDPKVHDPMPADALRVSQKRYAELLAGQERGAQIVPSANGKPTLEWPPAVDPRADLIRRIKREARRRIEAISPPWRQLNDMRRPSKAGQARFARIDAIRAASAAIEAEVAALPPTALGSFDLRGHAAWPADNGDTGR